VDEVRERYRQVRLNILFARCRGRIELQSITNHKLSIDSYGHRYLLNVALQIAGIVSSRHSDGLSRCEWNMPSFPSTKVEAIEFRWRCTEHKHNGLCRRWSVAERLEQ
jgi:hypothetical protein